MSNLSPQLALRIGLAARALPGVAPARLVRVLIDALKLPLTDQKLKQITVEQLRTAARGDLRRLPLGKIEAAIRYLWDRAGVDIIDPSIPAPAPYRDGDMPGSVRVAIASNDGLALNGDFGTCLRFLVYQVGETESRLIAIRATGADRSADDRNAWRAELVDDCQLILVASVSIRAAAKLVKNGTYLATYSEADTAANAIEGVQRVLRDGPPPWLMKVLATGATPQALPIQQRAYA